LKTDPDPLHVEVQPGRTTTALVYPAGPNRFGAALILGHGAGADQRSSWIVSVARGLSRLGLEIITFNFLYTELRKGAPDRRPVLDGCYRAVIDAIRQKRPSAGGPLFIGGKSMGGRIATHIAADNPDLQVKGLVLLGYPLHPPGRPDRQRDAHLPAVARPMLFVQGSRDTFGTPGELTPVLARISPQPTLHVVEGGDHSFKVSRNAARQAAVMEDVQQTVVGWVKEQL
jgi:hypothetical protein